MAAKAGDNRKAEEQRKVLFFTHVEKRMAIDAKISELREDRKKATGLAKADGIKSKRLDKAIAGMTCQDEQAFLDEYVADGEVLEWLGMFPGFQADMFKDRMPSDERVERAGALAGYANQPRESGYAADSKETQIWLKAYDRAAKSRADNLADAMEAAEKARQKGTAATKKKAAKSKAGAPLNGETPDDAKQAANQNGQLKENPPRPPKPGEANARPDDDKTNAEREQERQDAAAFH